jgi:hypothetical protein
MRVPFEENLHEIYYLLPEEQSIDIVVDSGELVECKKFFLGKGFFEDFTDGCVQYC